MWILKDMRPHPANLEQVMSWLSEAGDVVLSSKIGPYEVRTCFLVGGCHQDGRLYLFRTSVYGNQVDIEPARAMLSRTLGAAKNSHAVACDRIRHKVAFMKAARDRTIRGKIEQFLGRLWG